ncbi:MAG: porin [Verrucomicrobiales bacterium]
MNGKLFLLVLASHLIFSGQRAVADTDPVFELKHLWDYPVLHQDDEHPWLQKVAFIGRYHLNFWSLDSNFGTARDWQTRRARLGMQAVFFRDWIFDFNLNLGLEGGGRFIRSVEEVRLRWKPNPHNTLYLGRLQTRLTNEWWQASNSLDTVERSILFPQAVHDKMWGVLWDGSHQDWLYSLGVYSASRDADWNTPSFEGGAVFYGGIGRRFAPSQSLRVDYAFQTASNKNNATRPYQQVATLSYDGRFETWRWRADLLYGVGLDGVPDVYGGIVYPVVTLVPERWFAVARYQWVTGQGDAPLSIPSRYDREAPDLPSTRGKDYQAVYVGLNHHLQGHQLKLQFGVEYSTAQLSSGDRYEGWTLLSGFRFSFF